MVVDVAYKYIHNVFVVSEANKKMFFIHTGDPHKSGRGSLSLPYQQRVVKIPLKQLDEDNKTYYLNSVCGGRKRRAL